MTFPKQPYHVEQACKLLETGQCQLPVDWSDLAARVARHENFAHALRRAHEGEPQLLRMITETCAMALCKEQDDAA